MMTENDHWQQLKNYLSPSTITPFRSIFWSRFVSEFFLMFLLQYMGLQFSFLNATHSPIWFASGTAFAFTVLRGPRALFGISIGSWFAFYMQSFSLMTVTLCTLLMTSQTYCLLQLLYRFIGPTLLFDQRKKWLLFLFLSMSITLLHTYLLFQCCLPFLIKPTILLFFQWWFANLNGLCIIACALIALDAYFPEIYLINNISKTYYLLWFTFFFFILFWLCQEPTFLSIMISITTLYLFFLMHAATHNWCSTISSLVVIAFSYNLLAYLSLSLFHPLQNSLFIASLLLITTIQSLYISIPSTFWVHQHEG